MSIQSFKNATLLTRLQPRCVSQYILQLFFLNSNLNCEISFLEHCIINMQQESFPPVHTGGYNSAAVRHAPTLIYSSE